MAVYDLTRYSPETQRKLTAVATPRNCGYSPQTPTPAQAAFLLLSQREAFFGGAAGPGKSSALLMAALQYVDMPKYAALILRRTYSDLSLPGAIMSRAHEWLQPTDAKWNDREKTYVFPSGATLTFGYLENETDKYRYQGSELQTICFDEICQFTESQYTYLLSRLRRLEGVTIPLRLRCAGNPGGIGHEWVKGRFVTGGRASGRPFIPAKLTDNPHLDQAAYRASLSGLDDVTRRQLEDGDWDVVATGGLFDRAWFVPVSEPYVAVSRVRAYDLAATAQGGDYSVGVRMARTTTGTYIVEDVVRGQWAVGERDSIIGATAGRDGYEVDIVLEEEGGSAGKSQTASVAARLAGYVVRGERPTGPKDVRARPFASQLAAGNVRVVSAPWTSAYVSELCAFPSGAFDDQCDASSLAFAALTPSVDMSLVGLDITGAAAGRGGWGRAR